MDHIITFSFLSLFSLPDAFFHSPTNCRSLHRVIGTLPYALPHTNLVLILLIVCIQDFCIYSKKEGSFPPELRLKFISSHRFTSLHLRTFIPSLYFVLPTPFALSHCSEPPSHTILHPSILHPETISLLQNRTLQHHIGFTLRSPISTDFCRILGISPGCPACSELVQL